MRKVVYLLTLKWEELNGKAQNQLKIYIPITKIKRISMTYYSTGIHNTIFLFLFKLYQRWIINYYNLIILL